MNDWPVHSRLTRPPLSHNAIGLLCSLVTGQQEKINDSWAVLEGLLVFTIATHTKIFGRNDTKRKLTGISSRYISLVKHNDTLEFGTVSVVTPVLYSSEKTKLRKRRTTKTYIRFLGAKYQPIIDLGVIWGDIFPTIIQKRLQIFGYQGTLKPPPHFLMYLRH